MEEGEIVEEDGGCPHNTNTWRMSTAAAYGSSAPAAHSTPSPSTLQPSNPVKATTNQPWIPSPSSKTSAETSVFFLVSSTPPLSDEQEVRLAADRFLG
ncbi:uncharacterized protein LOC110936275 isoform X2 [Helianthus annuus]|uniref:uncharacterized protein LOC110936275 isoform X2 n=1 Tax=Helianthus annuus TaxID=4232 RepID=UPI000B8EFA35|nr:uncharacterized protein LOC110936275 isoform X2 [Helianthus annuus]